MNNEFIEKQTHRIISDIECALGFSQGSLRDYVDISNRIKKCESPEDFDNLASDVASGVFLELFEYVHDFLRKQNPAISKSALYEALLVSFIRSKVNDDEATINWNDAVDYLIEDMGFNL